MAKSPKTSDPFFTLVALMARLRAPGGCPWDRKQTARSIARNLLEEAHEAYEAIGDRRPEHLMEELGDLLLQIVFQSQMAAEKGCFTIDDVCRTIHAKLIRRHPHVFGDLKLKDATAVVKNWERIKIEERKEKGSSHGVLDGIPKSLPALVKAYRLGEKAGRVGFDWRDARHVLPKVREELLELKKAMDRPRERRNLKEELGDLFFSLAQWSRHARIDPEEALNRACRKFFSRFRRMERLAGHQGKEITELPAVQKERLWEATKNLRGSSRPKPT